MSTIKVGIHYETYDPIAKQRQVWRAVEDAGFDQIWNSDHLAKTPSSGDPTGPILDAWTALAAQAADTKRVRIGLMVAGSLYRHPGMHAKIGATIDHLSNGRLEFGIGAGWNEPEFVQLGMEFPPLGERLGRFGEAVRVIKRLWTKERANFNGRYFTLTDAIAEPKPLQKPYPPIWIGGSGPQRTLKVVARHGDVWNSNSGEFEKTVALSKILDEHCAAVDRDPQAVRRSVQFRLGTVDESLKTAETYLRAGFTEQIVMLAGPDPVRGAALAAKELLPRMRQLG